MNVTNAASVYLCIAGLLVAVACGEKTETVDHPSQRSFSGADTGTYRNVGPVTKSPPELVARGPVLVPDTSEKTEWLGQVNGIEIDVSSHELFGLQKNRANVVRFTFDGKLVATYGGRRGRGPGEITRLVDFSVSDDAVALLDRGNARVLVYDRAGRLAREFPVSPYHRSIAFFRNQIMLIPGDTSAIDVFSRTGVHVGSLGERSDLPARCEGSGCHDAPVFCRGCEVVASASLLVVVNTDQSMITAFDASGATEWRRDFLEEDALVASWAEMDEPVVKEMQREVAGRAQGDSRTEVFKSYFMDAQASGDEIVTLAVVPSAAAFSRFGYELWLLDPVSGNYRRYRYPRQGVGYLAGGTNATGFFGIDPITGGIFRFALP